LTDLKLGRVQVSMWENLHFRKAATRPMTLLRKAIILTTTLVFQFWILDFRLRREQISILSCALLPL